MKGFITETLSAKDLDVIAETSEYEVFFTNFTKYSIIYIVDIVFNSKVLFLYFLKG